MCNDFALSFGSNCDDPIYFLRLALKTIVENGHIKLVKTSSLYLTSPVETKIQPYFLNFVSTCKSNLDPNSLLNYLKFVEKQLGRKSKNHKEKRTIDIDIVYFNSIVIKTKDLILPHPSLEKRLSVLIPLDEINPEWLHPTIKLTPKEIISFNSPKGEVKKVSYPHFLSSS